MTAPSILAQKLVNLFTNAETNHLNICVIVYIKSPWRFWRDFITKREGNWICLYHIVRLIQSEHIPLTEKFFRSLIKSTWYRIVFTIFQLIWIQADVRLDQNQSEIGKYNLISVWFNKISLFVYLQSTVCF